ncbi:hypothetical protein AAHE18_15G133500 [Arachis hypogaea]
MHEEKLAEQKLEKGGEAHRSGENLDEGGERAAGGEHRHRRLSLERLSLKEIRREFRFTTQNLDGEEILVRGDRRWRRSSPEQITAGEDHSDNVVFVLPLTQWQRCFCFSM